MNTRKYDVRKYVHKFRNALVRAAELESHRLYSFGRWNELNSFPYGSCDIASNFLSAYLKQKGIESKVIWCKNELSKYRDIKSHVWLEIYDHFIDITISQFPKYCLDRIYICEKASPSILSEIYRSCYKLGGHNYQEREIEINTRIESGYQLFQEIVKMADAD